MKKLTWKKGILTALIVAVMAISTGVMAACGSTKKTVTISGSSSVSPLMQALAQEFEKKNKDISIRITTSDSSTGITDTVNGKNDIGMASRALKSGETGSVTATKICDDGVVIIVNKNSAAENVTGAQVFDLYAKGTAIGDITAAVSREEGSGTRNAFDSLIKSADGKKLSEETLQSVDIQNSTGSLKTEIANNSGKLGYISLGSLDDTVKALTFEGVTATADNVRNGSYKLARPFNIVVKDMNALSAEAKKFIDFILSEAGQKIVDAEGYVSLAK